MRAGFIGVGHMGSALVRGMVRSGIVEPKNIWAYDKDSRKLSALRRSCGIRVARSNGEVARRSHVLFLCVKPGQISEVLSDASKALTEASSRTVIVSIAAGVPLARLQSGLPMKTPVVRVMPNTPALLGAGAIVLSPGRWASSRDVRRVRRLFSTVGETAILKERYMNAVTAVSGSGPAYIFYLVEAMREACRALGLPAAVSERLCRQTVYGAGLMLKKLPTPARLLRTQVTSPGGTTEAAIRQLESAQVRRWIKKAILKAAARAEELARAA